MNLALLLIAALVGYLCGALSFARLIVRRLAPGQRLSAINVAVPGSTAQFTFRSISATTVRLQFGPKYGCLTSVLDMLKVIVPTALFRSAYPEAPYFLVAAAAGVIGHNWPVYYRFQGGRGQSPIMGGMLVIDPIGLLVTNIIGLPIGQFVIRRVLAVGSVWIILLMPWMLLRGDVPGLLYAVVVNVAYWIATVPELREYQRLRRQGDLTELNQEVQMWDMGRSFGRLPRVFSGRRKPIVRSKDST